MSFRFLKIYMGIMFLHFIFLAAPSLSFLCTHQVSSCDHNCTDYPVFSPSRLVVKYGDSAKAACTVCQECHQNIFDVEKAVGDVTGNGSTLLWTVDRLTEWDIPIKCYYTTDNDDQCCSDLELTVYQPPENVSISFVNHTGPMFENQQYSLQCSVEKVAPVQNLTVTFYRGNTALAQLQSNSKEKKPVSETFTLNITASKEDDGAQYRCEAKLELGPGGPQRPPMVASGKLTARVYYLKTTTVPTTTPPLATSTATTTTIRLPTTTTTKPTTSLAVTATTATTATTTQGSTEPNSGSSSKLTGRFLCLMLLFSALI